MLLVPPQSDSSYIEKEIDMHLEHQEDGDEKDRADYDEDEYGEAGVGGQDGDAVGLIREDGDGDGEGGTACYEDGDGWDDYDQEQDEY